MIIVFAKLGFVQLLDCYVASWVYAGKAEAWEDPNSWEVSWSEREAR